VIIYCQLYPTTAARSRPPPRPPAVIAVALRVFSFEGELRLITVVRMRTSCERWELAVDPLDCVDWSYKWKWCLAETTHLSALLHHSMA